MKIRDANIRIIETLKDFIFYAKECKSKFCQSEKNFTRERSLSFERTILMIVNLNKRSLSVELENFFGVIGQTEKCCTNGAFCRQRQKLNFTFFWAWNQLLVKSYYQLYGENIKRWRGYRIIGVDGSTGYLINEAEVIESFGVQENQWGSVAMGRIMNCFDVLNGISIDQRLLPIKFSEREIALEWMASIEIEDDCIYLYDRGYPSFALFWLHSKGFETVKHAVWRCPKNFNRKVASFVKSKKRSTILTLRATKDAINALYRIGYRLTEDDTVKIRFIKVKLSTTETEILATTLLDKQQFPCGIFKNLYGLRWGVETEYGAWKNIYQLEQFSGRKVETILQDFYATAFISNLHHLLIKEGEDEIKKVNKHRKWEYKINRNVTCGLLKNEVIKLFLSEDSHTILDKLRSLFCKYIQPIRKGRRYPRKQRYKRFKGKYRTLRNYKRAI